STSTSRCCNASPYRSPSARFATPASRSTTRASSVSSKSSCTAALTSAAGPPSKSTRPSSPPSTSPTDATASTNCATTCAGSRATDYCSVTDPDTPIVSPQRAFRSPCSSSSSTNGSAAHSPTAASTTAPPPAISRPAGWKPPITAPTQPSNASSICLLPDVHLASAILGLFLSTIRRGRIYRLGSQPATPCQGLRRHVPACESLWLGHFHANLINTSWSARGLRRRRTRGQAPADHPRLLSCGRPRRGWSACADHDETEMSAITLRLKPLQPATRAKPDSTGGRSAAP